MILSHQESFSTRALCAALGEPRASWYRFRKPHPMISQISRSPRRLTDTEELRVLNTLNSERFQDMAPGEAYVTLLDEDVYLCSERTMYRILSRHGQNVIRRQSAPRVYAKPELLATRPNELWSWDITKLKGPVKWTYYYLYKILDVYSRYVVGWLVAYRESAALAKDLIAEVCLNQEIMPGSLRDCNKISVAIAFHFSYIMGHGYRIDSSTLQPFEADFQRTPAAVFGCGGSRCYRLWRDIRRFPIYAGVAPSHHPGSKGTEDTTPV